MRIKFMWPVFSWRLSAQHQHISLRRHASLFSNHRHLTVSLRECKINSLSWWPLCSTRQIFFLFFQITDVRWPPWWNAPPRTSASPAWTFHFLWSQRHTSVFLNCRCQTVSLRQRPLLHECALLCDHKDIPLNFWTAGVWQSPWGSAQ